MKNKNTEINTRQLCIFYCIYSLSVKVLILPSILAAAAGNFAWIAALIGVLCEILFVFIAIAIAKYVKNKPALVKILYVIFLPILLLQLFIAAKTIYTLLNESFFDTSSAVLFLSPLVIAAVFFCMPPTRSFFRAGEILWGVILTAFAIAIIPTLYSINWPDFKILTHGSMQSVLPAVITNLLYFESAIFIIIFSQKVQDKKRTRTASGLFITAAACGIFFTAVAALFTVYFGGLGTEKTIALDSFTTVSQYITNTGSFNWLLSCTWLIMLLLRFGITVVMGFICIKNIFGIKRGQNV